LPSRLPVGEWGRNSLPEWGRNRLLETQPSTQARNRAHPPRRRARCRAVRAAVTVSAHRAQRMLTPVVLSAAGGMVCEHTARNHRPC
jgi:hypothetical protein